MTSTNQEMNPMKRWSSMDRPFPCVWQGMRALACALVVLGAPVDASPDTGAQQTSASFSQGTKPTAPSRSSGKQSTAPAKAAPGNGADKDAATDAKRHVFMLPLDGMVGIGLRHDEMEKVEQVADKIGPGQVIILRINSNGGLVIEGDMIAESLTRIKQKHRLVAWIEKAISGGAFTALWCDEMYFMPEAALGSITMLTGRTEVSAVREEWKERVAEACAGGGRDPLIGPAMVHSEVELSYEKTPDGKVTFYPDVKHTYVLSRSNENLDFNAQNAEHCGFSDGTAKTDAELYKLLGVDDGEKYIISDAGKKIAAEWQKLIKDCKDKVPLLLRKRDIEGTSEGGVAQLQARIKNNQAIIDWFKKCRPEMVYELGVGDQAIESLKEENEELRKQVKELQAAPRENRGN